MVMNDNSSHEVMEHERLNDLEVLYANKIEKLNQVKDPNKDLFPPLTRDQKTDIYRKMIGGSDIVARKYSLTITTADLQKLTGRQWLNDELINFYGAMIMERAAENQDKYPKIYVFSTFFYEKLKGGYGQLWWSSSLVQKI
jgi:Ulp1 family protease